MLIYRLEGCAQVFARVPVYDCDTQNDFAGHKDYKEYPMIFRIRFLKSRNFGKRVENSGVMVEALHEGVLPCFTVEVMFRRIDLIC